MPNDLMLMTVSLLILQVCPDGENMLARDCYTTTPRVQRIRIPEELRAELFKRDALCGYFPVLVTVRRAEQNPYDLRAMTNWKIII